MGVNACGWNDGREISGIGNNNFSVSAFLPSALYAYIELDHFASDIRKVKKTVAICWKFANVDASCPEVHSQSVLW